MASPKGRLRSGKFLKYSLVLKSLVYVSLHTLPQSTYQRPIIINKLCTGRNACATGKFNKIIYTYLHLGTLGSYNFRHVSFFVPPCLCGDITVLLPLDTANKIRMNLRPDIQKAANDDRYPSPENNGGETGSPAADGLNWAHYR